MVSFAKQKKSIFSVPVTRGMSEELEELTELEEEEKMDGSIAIQACECTKKMASLNKLGEYCSYFASDLLPVVLVLMGAERPYTERCLALCAYDDLLELSWEAAQCHFHHFIDLLLTNVTVHDASLRQSAAYGLGLWVPAF